MKKSFLQNKTLLFVIISVVILLIFSKVFVSDNPDVLCFIAEGLDDPSTLFYFVVERIYKTSDTGDIVDKFLDYLRGNKNENLHSLYIRVLGALGDNKAFPILKQYFMKHQHNKSKKIELYNTVKSIGLIGGGEAVGFLESLFMTGSMNDNNIDASTISVALYLSTGDDNYEFVNTNGKLQKLKLTKGLIEARKAIISSKDRQREAQELIIIDRIFRPPGSRWGHDI